MRRKAIPLIRITVEHIHYVRNMCAIVIFCPKALNSLNRLTFFNSTIRLMTKVTGETITISLITIAY